MKSLHLYINTSKPKAKEAFGLLASMAEEFGFAVTGGETADVVLAIGGDGTMLRAVREFPDTPLLGLNLGGLGFLSSVGRNEFRKAFEMLADGRYKVAERSALMVRKASSKFSGRDGFGQVALNDVVIMREMSGHAAVLDLSVDSKRPTRYFADGIVVATPTGSTAYSLSAGGPVLMPDSGSFVVTPINPHALGIRPLVVGDSARLSVVPCARCDRKECKIGVYADGENVFMLDDGEVLEIVKATKGVAMVELEGYDPYEVLARKLGWSGSSVHTADENAGGAGK